MSTKKMSQAERKRLNALKKPNETSVSVYDNLQALRNSGSGPLCSTDPKTISNATHYTYDRRPEERVRTKKFGNYVGRGKKFEDSWGMGLEKFSRQR